MDVCPGVHNTVIRTQLKLIKSNVSPYPSSQVSFLTLLNLWSSLVCVRSRALGCVLGTVCHTVKGAVLFQISKFIIIFAVSVIYSTWFSHSTFSCLRYLHSKAEHKGEFVNKEVISVEVSQITGMLKRINLIIWVLSSAFNWMLKGLCVCLPHSFLNPLVWSRLKDKISEIQEESCHYT